MSSLRAIVMKLLGLVKRRSLEQELDSELESHLEMAVEDNVRAGMSPEEARRRARVVLGSAVAGKEACREAAGFPWLESTIRDLRHAVRAMRRYSLFSLVVVISLGLSFGSNAAILQLGYQLFLRAVPIDDPSSVVVLYSTYPDTSDGAPIAFMNWRDVAEQSRTLEAVGGYEWTSLVVTLDGSTSRVAAQLVSGNYFDLLGLRASEGRTFSAEAAAIPGAPLEAVVSHAFFQRRLGGDRTRIGETIRIEGQPFTLVGVAPPEFTGVEVGLPVELWVPFGVYRQLYPETDWVWYEARRGLVVYGLGRLPSGAGATLEEARAELSGIARRLEETYPEDNENRGIHVLPIAQATIFPWARPFVRNGILLLCGAVLLTLLIAAVNVANLFLLRLRERSREVAVHLALGVSRSALAARLVTECLVLSLLGGACGVWVLWLSQKALMRILSSIPSPTASSYTIVLELAPAVLIGTFALALGVGLLLAVFPVLAALRARSAEALRTRGSAASEQGSKPGRLRLRSALLIAQLALSFVALLGGGLFLRSLQAIRTLDPGFESHRLGFVHLDLSLEDDESAIATRERIVTAVSRIAGVERVGLSPREPMDGGWTRPFAPAEWMGEPDRRITPYTDRVDGAFFDAMGLAMLEGRTFTIEEEQNDDAPPVAILNQVLADRLWPGTSAVGRTLVLFDLEGQTPLEIVGVVETASYRRVTENPQGYVYMPLPRDHTGFLTLALRTTADPAAVVAEARSELRRLEPSVPILEAITVTEVLDRSMWGPRLAAALLGAFAVVALALSAVGIYGVVSFDVNRRIREFGIRVALGARRLDIMRKVAESGGAHYAMGIMLGLPLAYAVSRFVASLVFVDWLDPWALAFSFVPLLLVGCAASLLPARRATAVNPNEVLRSE